MIILLNLYPIFSIYIDFEALNMGFALDLTTWYI